MGTCRPLAWIKNDDDHEHDNENERMKKNSSRFVRMQIVTHLNAKPQFLICVICEICG